MILTSMETAVKLTFVKLRNKQGSYLERLEHGCKVVQAAAQLLVLENLFV